MNDNIKKTLSVQIKNGYLSQYGGMDALNNIFSIVDSILIKDNYNRPDEEQVKSQIQSIFDIKPYFEDSTMIVINWSCNPLTDEEGHKIILQPYTKYGYPLLYINHKLGFATYAYYIPELLDYTKLYPELSELENEVLMYEELGDTELHEVVRWKDLEAKLSKERNFNTKFILSLNKYLFNNDKVSLVWLENNYPEFIQSLVISFGYTKDKDLLKWVLENNEFYCDFSENKHNINEYTKIFTHRKCNGALVFNSDVLDYLKENINKNYLEQIASYINTTSADYTKPTILTNEFNFAERAELYARLLYWGENIVRSKNEYRSYSRNFMVAFCVKNENFEEYSDEFKRRNYYDLPEFEQYWNNALQLKIDEYDNPIAPERSPFIEEDQG